MSLSKSTYIRTTSYIGNPSESDLDKKDVLNIEFQNTGIALVNSLIRTMMSDVMTLSVDCDSDNVIENDTIYDSQFIANLRLSLLPVITTSEMLKEYQKYHIYLCGSTIKTPLENKTNDILSVYVHDLTILKDSETGTESTKIIPIDLIRYDHLLLKLHKGQKIHISGAKIEKNTGTTHARFQSVIVRKYEPVTTINGVKCAFETQGNMSIKNALVEGVSVLSEKLSRLSDVIIHHIINRVLVSFIMETSISSQISTDGMSGLEEGNSSTTSVDISVVDMDEHPLGTEDPNIMVGPPRLVKLLIRGETETIGWLLLKTAQELVKKYQLMDLQNLIFSVKRTHVDEQNIIISIAFEQTTITGIQIGKMLKDLGIEKIKDVSGVFPQHLQLLCATCKYLTEILKNIKDEFSSTL